MAHLVGPKGQVVIEKAIREQLGVKPGWQALQILVDNHVEVYFVPPPHSRSLAGCLASYVKGPIPDDDEAAWDRAIGEAIASDFQAECSEEGRNGGSIS